MELTYREPRRALIRIVAFSYLAVFLVVAFLFFDPLADMVNTLAEGGFRAAGLIFAVVVITPVILLIVIAYRRVDLRQDATTLTIRTGRTEVYVPRAEIASMTVNDAALGVIVLSAGDGSELARLRPRLEDTPAVVALLTEGDHFMVTDRRPVLRGRVEARTYRRR